LIFQIAFNLKLKQIYFILFLFTVSSFHGQPKKDFCTEFKEESIDKLKYLKTQLDQLPSPNYFSKTELITIILPEYLTYSKFKNEAEIAYLIFNYSSQNERFKTISFGPFQMQLRFIDDILIKASKKNIKDPILRNYSVSNYQYLIDNLQHLNKLSTQWEILKCFEKITLQNNLKHNDKNEPLKKLIQLYNSGGFNQKINDQAFSKITCSTKSYESWCYVMKEWMLKNNFH